MSEAFESMWGSLSLTQTSMAMRELLNMKYYTLTTFKEYVKEIGIQQRALFKDWNFMQVLKSRLDTLKNVQNILENDGITQESMQQYKIQEKEFQQRIKFYENIIQCRHEVLEFALDTLDGLDNEKTKDE